MKKILQKFDEDYFERTRDISPTAGAQFLEEYRLLYASQLKAEEESILISIKIPKTLLKSFRKKCDDSGVKYQTQIKALMWKWMGL